MSQKTTLTLKYTKYVQERKVEIQFFSSLQALRTSLVTFAVNGFHF